MTNALVITVSGTGSGAGKTQLIEKLLPCLGEAAAVKARVYEERDLAILSEDDPAESPEKDTGRFLAAGARKAFLISGRLEDVRRAVEEIIAGAGFGVIVIESNRMSLELQADLSVFVRGDGVEKAGGKACEESADVCVYAVRARPGEKSTQ